MRSLKHLALASTLVILPAAAQTADAPRTNTVSGHGEASGTPDEARISAGVTTQAKTAAAALADNANAMGRVMAALKRLGVADKNIQTSDFSVQPQYAPYNQNNADMQRIVGYQVTDQVNVTLDHVANVGPAIDALVNSGANQMNGVSFSIRDPGPLLAEARTQAVDDATARAETLTHAAHVTLGPILSIQEETAEVPRPIMFAARAMAAKAAPTPVAAGEQTLSTNVSITWQIQ